MKILCVLMEMVVGTVAFIFVSLSMVMVRVIFGRE